LRTFPISLRCRFNAAVVVILTHLMQLFSYIFN